MNKKKVLILSLIVLVTAIIIFILFFLICYYKNKEKGNTIINKSEEDIIENILNMKSYKATLDISIESNKNKNKYVVKQSLNGKVSKQEVIQPSNISGIITEYDGNNIKIYNNKFNLSTIYDNFKYVLDNRLWLDSFIYEYKDSDNSKISINEKEEIVLEIKNKDDIYNTYKRLYVDKKSGKPIRLTIEDINKKVLVYILYKEIEISK